MYHRLFLQFTRFVRAGNYCSSRQFSAAIIPLTHIQTLLKHSNQSLSIRTKVLEFVRYYAKGKDKKKEKGKSTVSVNENQLGELINVDSFKTQLQKALEVLKSDFSKHLSLRSTTGSIESITIHLDGKEHTLQELAQIVRKNPKTVVINMSVFPQAIPAVVKAIQTSGMNLNPQQEGTTLYIPVPKVTKEHRENLAKNAKALFVKCKTNIKDVQNKELKNLKRKDGISIDLVRSIEQQVSTIANNYVSEAEKILENKQIELVGKDS